MKKGRTVSLRAALSFTKRNLPVSLAILSQILAVLVQVFLVLVDVLLILVAIHAVFAEVALVVIDVALVGVAIRTILRQIFLIILNIFLVTLDVLLLRSGILALGISTTGEQTGKSKREHTLTAHDFCVHAFSPYEIVPGITTTLAKLNTGIAAKFRCREVKECGEPLEEKLI